jgi:hypothetical protein
MAVYAESEDLINVGAYHPGSNPVIDEAIAKHQPIKDLLIQEVTEHSSLEETFAMMTAISGVPIPVDGTEEKDPSAKPSAGQPPFHRNGGETMQAQSSVASLFAARGFDTVDMQ